MEALEQGVELGAVCIAFIAAVTLFFVITASYERALDALYQNNNSEHVVTEKNE